jgi:hypothetical protein
MKIAQSVNALGITNGITEVQDINTQTNTIPVQKEIIVVALTTHSIRRSYNGK